MTLVHCADCRDTYETVVPAELVRRVPRCHDCGGRLTVVGDPLLRPTPLVAPPRMVSRCPGRPPRRPRARGACDPPRG